MTTSSGLGSRRRRRGSTAGVWLLVVLAAAAIAALLVGGASRAGASSSCIEAGLSRPQIVEAVMTHPGDHYTQSVLLEFSLHELPDECQEDFTVALPSFQFQLQDHLHHSHWIALGPFRPSWHSPRRHGNLFALWAIEKGHGEKQPISQSRLYQCSPGTAVTKVRAILVQRVVRLASGRTAGTSTSTIPVTVKRVRAKLKHRGALPGPC